jgi:hypothetical protein
LFIASDWDRLNRLCKRRAAPTSKRGQASSARSITSGLRIGAIRLDRTAVADTRSGAVAGERPPVSDVLYAQQVFAHETVPDVDRGMVAKAGCLSNTCQEAGASSVKKDPLRALTNAERRALE